MKINKIIMICITILLYVNSMQNAETVSSICEYNSGHGDVCIYMTAPIPEVPNTHPAPPINETSSYYPTNHTIYGEVVNLEWSFSCGGDMMYAGDDSCVIEFNLTDGTDILIRELNTDYSDLTRTYEYELPTDIEEGDEITFMFEVYYYRTTSTPFDYVLETQNYTLTWGGLTAPPPSTTTDTNGDGEGLDIITILLIVGGAIVIILIVLYIIQKQQLQKACNINTPEGLNNLMYNEKCEKIRDKLLMEGKLFPQQPEPSMFGSPNPNVSLTEQLKPPPSFEEPPQPKKKYIGLTDKF